MPAACQPGRAAGADPAAHRGAAPEQVIDVPRTTSTDVIPQRAVLRVPQMAEQLVDEPVPSFDDFELAEEEEEDEHPQVVPGSRVRDALEQTVGSPVPQITEEIVDRILEQTVGSPVPQITEEIVDRILEQTVGSPVPQITEEIVDRILEQTVGSPVPQITEEIVERLQLVCDSPVPQIMEEIVEIRSPGQLWHISSWNISPGSRLRLRSITRGKCSM